MPSRAHSSFWKVVGGQAVLGVGYDDAQRPDSQLVGSGVGQRRLLHLSYAISANATSPMILDDSRLLIANWQSLKKTDC